MLPELLAGATTATLGLALLVARLVRSERRGVAAALGLGALAGLLVVVVMAARPAPVPESEVGNRPIESQSAGYVTSSTCRACHPHQYATWHDSYHRTMTQRADANAPLGDFGNVRLTRGGRTWELSRQGDECWVELDDPMAPPGGRAPRVRRRVVLTTGSHHMQLCWYETGYSRVMGLLPFVWLRSEQQWVPRQAAFVLPPSETIPDETGQWTLVCQRCHATNGRPRADLDDTGLHGADTQVSEMGIACEACHGPAAAHVRANQDPLRRYRQHWSGAPDPTIVQPARLPHRRATDVCGQCHGTFDLQLKGKPLRDFLAQGFTYRPGDDLSLTRPLTRKGMDEQFWPDGEPRVAGREFNAVVGSACFERGELSCFSCHVMHQRPDDPRPRSAWADDQLRPDADDRNCLQCHPRFADDVAAHTHHPAGSEGSRCYNCHMPFSTYALLKGVRNHRIASPSVASTLATGRPNACNLCHLDRTLAWTSEALERWYGTPKPNLSPDEHRHAAAVHWTLKGDAAQRALLAFGLGWDVARRTAGQDWIAPYLAELLDDPYEAVRLIARRSLRTLPGFEAFHPEVLGSAEDRARAKALVLARWRQGLVSPGDDRREAVLIGPDGALRTQEYARLLASRSQRQVKLFE